MRLGHDTSNCTLQLSCKYKLGTGESIHQTAVATFFFNNSCLLKGISNYFQQRDSKVGRIAHKNLGTHGVGVINRCLKTLSEPFVQCCFIESFCKV